jgi:catechol-2,3-dioxygenase
MSRTIDSSTLVKPSKFAHFVLRVRNLDESISWYETVLGMELVHRAEALAFMTYDDEHHRMALIQSPVAEESKPGAPGLDHVAYTLGSLGELLGTYRRLKANGILPGLPINHGPTTSIYYQDPDGNSVELQVENFDSMEDASAFIATETFQANPLGVPFDPEKLASRYENGDALEDLLKQGAA